MNFRRRIVLFALPALVASLTTAPRLVRAEPEPSTPGVEAEAHHAARAAFEEGRAAYEDGQFDVALERFERSYALSPHTELLYNIGIAADRLRDDARALEAFERFLREVTDPELRREVEQRVAALRAAQSRERWEERARELEQQGRPVDAHPLDPSTVAQGTSAAGEPRTPHWLQPSTPATSAQVDQSDGVFEQWWFWAGAAVLVAGGAASVYLLTRPQEPSTLAAPNTGLVVPTLRFAP